MTDSQQHPNQILDFIWKYLSLTKPKIILLLSLTGVIAYLLPNPSDITFFKVLMFLIMGYTTSGGAMAINNYIDRDIDIQMIRTQKRPSIEGINPPWKIIVFGASLVIIGVFIALYTFNATTAYLLIAADLFYLFGYSLALKRRSIYSTIIGGIISPTPVWVGYSAALGTIPLEGWLLGIIVFVWTPSHTWAMSARNIDDYTAADIPMLPVLFGMQTTAKATMVGGLITILYGYFVFLTFFFTNSTSSIIALVFITLSSVYFIYTLYLFVSDASIKNATLVFRFGHSIWLAVMFFSVLLDYYP